MTTTFAYRSFILAVLVTESVAQYDYDPNDTKSQNEAGAAGPSSDSTGISSGGMIALCVIVGVVVIIGFSSAALFFIAKKRQWAMREALRRSARQVVKAVTTPLTPRFPRSQRPRTRGREDVNRERRRPEMPRRKPTDLEKDAVITTTNEGPKDSGSSARGWSSYFSFNRS